MHGRLPRIFHAGLLLAILSFVSATHPAASPADMPKAAAPGGRVLLDAHNCYPYDGKWADRIERNLQEGGEKEIPASVIGETLMRELHDIDQVAYVRFASVYRSFKDIGEFMAELEDLIKERKFHPNDASATGKHRIEP